MSAAQPKHTTAHVVAAGRRYVEVGWHVVPLKPTGSGKEPRCRGWLANALTTRAKVENHWERYPDDGIGIACRPSGILVIDEDPARGGDLAALEAMYGPLPACTPRQSTGSGGRHVLLRHPGVPVQGEPWPGIDTRDAAQIVAWPTLRPDGGEYHWLEGLAPWEVPLAVVPTAWLDAIRKSVSPRRDMVESQPDHGADRWAATALTSEIRSVREAPKGQRNALLNLAAFNLGQLIGSGHLDETIVRADLADAAHACGLVDDDGLEATLATIDSGTRAGTAQPRERPTLGLASAAVQRAPLDIGIAPSSPIFYSDYANGLRLAELHGADLHYTDDGWYAWDGRRWQHDPTMTVVDRYAREVPRTIAAEASRLLRERGADDPATKAAKFGAKAAASRAGLVACRNVARSDVHARVEVFDATPGLLTCKNVTVDLRSGGVHEHRRADLLTKLVPTDYDSEATCPHWDECLLEWFGGDLDLIEYVDRLVGYSLIGDPREQLFVSLHGPSGTGKSTLLAALTTMAGEYAKNAAIRSLLARQHDYGPRSDLAVLRGARIVTTDEIRAQTIDGRAQVVDASLLKSISGNDPITCALKYQNEITYTPAFVIWARGNHRLALDADDQALWDRVREIPFDIRFRDTDAEDKGLRAALHAERAGILARAVHAAGRYYANGLGEMPAAARIAVADYRAEAMHGVLPDDWFKQRCEPRGRTPTKVLHADYTAWCKARDLEPVSETLFGRWLGGQGFKPYSTGKERGRIGIRLRSEPYEGD